MEMVRIKEYKIRLKVYIEMLSKLMGINKEL